jgi:hypothetical protein
MKKLILVLLLLIFLLIESMANASPFLTSDPANHAVGLQFEIWENVKDQPEHLIETSGTMIYAGDNKSDGAIWYDLKDIQSGTHYWYVRFVQQWGYDYTNGVSAGGKTYSVFVPFSFKKSTPVAAGIVGLKLAP